MTDSTLANTEGTDTSATNSQAAAKTYTQEEFDSHMARMKSSLQKKLLKPYEDLGDPEELRALRLDADKRQTEQQLKRGEFERTLQEMAAKKDAEIQKRDSIIKEYKVNSPLLSAAAKFRAVAPDQVKALLASNVRLNAEGDVEVVDEKGAVRYNDAGEPIQVEDLVRGFLDSNPHFVQATPTTTNTMTSHGAGGSNSVDLSKLDMRKPEHRKIYAEARAKGKI